MRREAGMGPTSTSATTATSHTSAGSAAGPVVEPVRLRELDRPVTGSAWAVGSAGVVMIGVVYGFARYGYGLFEPELREVFGLSVAASGALASSAYIGYVVALSAVGVLARRLGPRPLVTAAGVSAALGTGVVAVAREPWQLLIGLVVGGASSGFAWASYSDAVDQVVAPQSRHRVLAAISSGTAYGITVAGAAVLLGASWRWAWALFSAVAVLSTLHNRWALRDTAAPGPGNATGRLSLRSFLRRGTGPLYATSASYGVVGAVFWTFAVSAISEATPGSALVAAGFWTALGVAGMTAVVSGRVFERLGLARSQALLMAGLAAAPVLVALDPGLPVTIGLAAVVFGWVFMATAGLLSVWSYEVFPDRPTEGFSATVLFLGLGALVGPMLFGALADARGFRIALVAVAVVALVTLAARPRHLRSAA